MPPQDVKTPPDRLLAARGSVVGAMAYLEGQGDLVSRFKMGSLGLL